LERKWDNIEYVFLKKKKANGFPNGREIGEKLKVLGVSYSKNYTCLIIKGNKNNNDSFKIHESYVDNIAEKRNDTIVSILTEGLIYYSDHKRHLICYPYSIENLHLMAEDLQINNCWFHKDHYDIPKRRISEIAKKTVNISSKDIVRIINGEKLFV